MTAATGRSHIAAAMVLAASLLLVIGRVSLWDVGIALGFALWRIWNATGPEPPYVPTKGMRIFLFVFVAIFVFEVFASFRTLNGLAAGTSLLTLMGALKVIESKTLRDNAIVIGVALFLLLAAALGNQAMWRLPLYLLVLWGAGAAMAVVAHPHSTLTARAALRLATKALAMSLPLAAACFLFFPRMAGQFWAIESGTTATTGLSDEMSPTSIDRLVSEYTPVFRVRFNGPAPPPEARYWRGPVLNDFDGFTWRRSGGPYNVTVVERRGAAYSYRVTLEPTGRRWIFALETVDSSPRADVRLTHDWQLVASTPVYDTLTYDATSHLETRVSGALSRAGRVYETRLPAGRNPRALALARELRARVGSDAEYTRAVLDWFRDNGLTYSLEPGSGSVDSVDTVLFDTKLGFCGHFASSYATLMRAAGIPARVVTGYLGGEYNPIGNYWIVRQSDAHAWTEVWLASTGWTRIDPTSVVAPERLRSGAYDALPDGQASTGVAIWRNSWMSGLSRMWDGANEWWRENVLEFNLRSQFDFLRALGIDSPDWKHLGWAFAGALLAWITWVSLALRRSVARRRPDRIARAWLKATRKLAKVAPARTPDEGPLAFAARISIARPDLAAQVSAISTRYAQLRFGPDPEPGEIENLEQDVRRLAA